MAIRPKMLTVRLAADEWKRLGRVAAHFNLTVAATVRMLVKREADAIRARQGTERRTTS